MNLIGFYGEFLWGKPIYSRIVKGGFEALMGHLELKQVIEEIIKNSLIFLKKSLKFSKNFLIFSP